MRRPLRTTRSQDSARVKASGRQRVYLMASGDQPMTFQDIRHPVL